MICKRKIPIASTTLTRRPAGLAKGKFKIPDSFFDELPEDMIRSFEKGEDLQQFSVNFNRLI